MTVYALNLVDLAFTHHALGCGGVEANPLMRSVPVMIAYKLVVVGVLCWWLRRREEPIARYGLNALAVVYGLVNVWHIWNLLMRR